MPPPARRHDQASTKYQRGATGSGAASCAANAARRLTPPERKQPRRRPHALSARRRGLRTIPRGRAAAAGPPRPSAKPPRAQRHDQARVRSASTAPQAAAPRAPRDGRCPQRGSERAGDCTQRARAAEHYVPCQESELPPWDRSGRASRRRERGGTTKPVPGAPARRCRQRRCERRATAPPKERNRPRRRPHSESASRLALRTVP